MELLSNNEYHKFYKPYISVALSKNLSLVELLSYSEIKAVELFKFLTKDQQNYRYASDKWSVKEILQHLIDAERILSYRALRFGRYDKTNLAGYDIHSYVKYSFCKDKNFRKMLKEFKAVRASTQMLFKSFSSITLKNTGLNNNCDMSVRAIGFIISGHQLHHLNIIRERYL